MAATRPAGVSLNGLVAAVRVRRGPGAGCDPAAGSYPNQEQRIIARCRNADPERKAGIARGAELRGRTVNVRLSAGRTRIANQRPDDRADRPRRARSAASVQYQSFHVEEPLTSSEIDSGAATPRRPGSGATMDLTDRVVDSRGGDHALESTPTHDILALGESTGAQNQCQQQTAFLHMSWSFLSKQNHP